MTNCMDRYIGNMPITLIELRLMPACTWKYKWVHCVVAIADFRWEIVFARSR